MTVRVALVLCLLFGSSAAAAEKERCAIPGERIHWLVDWCMLKMETDDEIAVSACIEKEHKAPGRDGCQSKRQFKRRMCELRIERGTLQGTVAACVGDPAFKGRTVEKGGVG